MQAGGEHDVEYGIPLVEAAMAHAEEATKVCVEETKATILVDHCM